MRISERGIKRRTVIEAYAKYDCSKKGQTDCVRFCFLRNPWSAPFVTGGRSTR
jgi:hypothetical protein